MASRTPIIGQVSIVGSLPLVALFIVAIVASRSFGYETTPGVIGVVGLFYLIRLNLPRNHRKGIREIKRGNYETSIHHFQKSLEQFQEKPWMDRFRSVIFLSSSPMTYKEMALVNTAWAHSQSGEKEKAIEWYQRALREFPDSQIAITALRMLTGEKVQQVAAGNRS